MYLNYGVTWLTWYFRIAQNGCDDIVQVLHGRASFFVRMEGIDKDGVGVSAIYNESALTCLVSRATTYAFKLDPELVEHQYISNPSSIQNSLEPNLQPSIIGHWRGHMHGMRE